MDIDLPDSDYRDELETAIQAALAAGEVADRYAQEGFRDWNKEDDSKVTEADLEAQETVVERIRDEFPEDGFLAEEEGLSEESERRWVIDPIDGTFNFSKGNSFFCVSIAFEIDGDAKAGVVYSPKEGLDELYYAAEDTDAFLQDSETVRKIQVSSYDRIKDCLIYKALLNVYDGSLEDNRAFLYELFESGGESREGGACALEMCKVAGGEADGSVHAIVNPWDFKAARVIVESAGGEVRVRKSKYPGSHEVLSSNGEIHERLMQLVEGFFVD